MRDIILIISEHKKVLVIYILVALLVTCIQVPSLRDRIFLPQIDKVDNSLAQDVSFAELKTFLDNCQTIQGDPTRGCTEYAQDLHNEAESQGIRAAIVVLPLGEFPHIGFHMINAFETTDKGKVYVDAGLGYALEPRQYGIAQRSPDGIYRIETQVGETEIWHGSYSTIEPKYIKETLGRERMFWVCW